MNHPHDRRTTQPRAKFVSKYADLTNHGIPCFVEKRLLDRACQVSICQWSNSEDWSNSEKSKLNSCLQQSLIRIWRSSAVSTFLQNVKICTIMKITLSSHLFNLSSFAFFINEIAMPIIFHKGGCGQQSAAEWGSWPANLTAKRHNLTFLITAGMRMVVAKFAKVKNFMNQDMRTFRTSK